MTADSFTEWLLRSLATGAAATMLVLICPPSWRGRFRLWVPVLAFAALLFLAVGLVRPLPQVRIEAPVPLDRVAAWNPGAWLITLWISGALLCFARQAMGWWTIRELLKGTRAVPGRIWRQTLEECQRSLGLRGKVRLRFAGPEFVPSATGLLRRTILLPDEAAEWTPEQRRLVLMHELGHFQRRDLWTDALGRIVCALHWFNPFVWMLQRQLSVEREYACDALVVQQGARPKDYATVLWQMATAARRRPSSAAAFLAMASPKMGKLEQRVRRILDSGRKSGLWVRFADASLCVVLGALLFACTACKPMQRMIAAANTDWTPAEIQSRLWADAYPAD
jgi:beta-lactamase regulating signal transducer with metallopeptidase domain